MTAIATKVARCSRHWFSTLSSFSTNSVSNHIHNLVSSYKFHVIDTAKTCDRFFAVKKSQPVSVVGLDCWSVDRNQTIGLLQLAFPDKECALVRLSKLNRIPGSLRSFLKDQSVLKCGVGIAKDTARLNENHKLVTNGLIELQHLAFRCGVTGSRSLAGLTELLTGYHFSKNKSAHRSNLEDDLSMNQIYYIVSDSIASLTIMEKLVSKELSRSRGFIRNIVEEWVEEKSVLESDRGIVCMYDLCQGLVGAPMEETVRISRHFTALELAQKTTPSMTSSATVSQSIRDLSRGLALFSTNTSSKHNDADEIISGYKCRVIETAKECDKFFAVKNSQPVSVVGLDCEYVEHKPTSLIQLAFPDKDCALVCLNKIGRIPRSLALFLNDQSVLKCGVGIADDAARLNKGYNVDINGLIELPHLAFRCGVTGSRSLQGLTKLLTGYHISKNAQRSNWEDDLSKRQIRYAASDAIAALRIMEKLVSKELSEGLSGMIRMILDRLLGTGMSRSVLESDRGIACMHDLCQGLVGAPMEETARLSRIFNAAERST